MGFFGAIGSAYTNILNFSGRASRAEYWWFTLWQFSAIFIVTFCATLYFASLPPVQAEALALRFGGISSVVFLLGFWLPSLSLLIRRLHDSDHSGWWFFIPVIPLIGTIILLFFLLMPSSHGRNRFGNHPYGVKGAAKVRLPRGMKPAPTEAERRAEILEYYRKNVAHQQGQPS